MLSRWYRLRVVCIPNEDRVNADLCRVRKPDLEILLRINTSSGSFDLEQKLFENSMASTPWTVVVAALGRKRVNRHLGLSRCDTT